MDITVHHAFLPPRRPGALGHHLGDDLALVLGDAGIGAGWSTLATPDLDGTFERLVAGGTEVVQEPTDQFYGVHDCAVRDPAGNLIRINQLS